MSRKEKAMERFCRLPSDYQWDELVSLLANLEFDMYSNDGSRVKFLGENDRVISLHRPHPGNTVKHYVLKDVYDRLKEWGEIDG